MLISIQISTGETEKRDHQILPVCTDNIAGFERPNIVVCNVSR
jgi:hypothetical protein